MRIIKYIPFDGFAISFYEATIWFPDNEDIFMKTKTIDILKWMYLKCVVCKYLTLYMLAFASLVHDQILFHFSIYNKKQMQKQQMLEFNTKMNMFEVLINYDDVRFFCIEN